MSLPQGLATNEVIVKGAFPRSELLMTLSPQDRVQARHKSSPSLL